MIGILQTNSPELGNVLNLAGIGLVLLAGFFYLQYKQTESKQERENARKQFTAVLLVFVFYAIVAYMYWDNADSWVVQLGESLNAYFEQVAQNIIIAEETAEVSENQSLLDRLLNGIRTIGLIAYVLLFGATAMVGKAPVKIYEALFGE
jgi:cytochrome bd-type quinol oxidase subunit 2